MASYETLGRREAKTVLRQIGGLDSAELDIGEAALVLAALDRPRVPLGRYRDHLQELGAAAREETGKNRATLAEAIAALAHALYERFNYAGDEPGYDDIQNANLMRVIDRRRGMPVSLGIIYISAARALGLRACGVNFPGHFLVRLEHGGGRTLVDPFHRGRACRAAELRGMVKTALGREVELAPGHYAAMDDRDVLLRLQNNIKFRLVRMAEFSAAAQVLDSMLLLAPDVADLWYESGLMRVRLGHSRPAMRALDRFLALTGNGHAERHKAAALLQDLRAKSG